MLSLRYYQDAAKAAVYDWIRTREDNPCVVIPTGGGKTPVIASICADASLLWNSRVIVLAHVKELLEQNAAKLHEVCPEIDFGIYSAGLKRRDKKNSVIVAGIQSVYRRAYEMDPFDVAIVDECNLLPMDGEGMYQTFLAEARKVNPHLRLIGFTATPYRTKDGDLCGPGHLLNGICYQIGVSQLVAEGYLSPLVGKSSAYHADLSNVPTIAGDFATVEMERAFNRPELVAAACREIVSKTTNRNGILVFTAGVQHGEAVAGCLRAMTGERVEFLTGETSVMERAKIISDFKRKECRWLVNINVLTMGFDAPHIDCVVLLRATESPGLYYQMLGRAFRLAPGKSEALILDYGENIVRHGPVDDIELNRRRRKKRGGEQEFPAKACPECQSVVPVSVLACPDCGYEWPPREVTHAAEADDAEPLRGTAKKEPPRITDTWVDVKDVTYSVHTKKGADEDAPRTMRVDYHCGLQVLSEWVCFEHKGFARKKAENWWHQHLGTFDAPISAQEAVDLGDNGGIPFAHRILVREVEGDRFPRVIDFELFQDGLAGSGILADPEPSEWAGNDDDIPF